MTSIFYIRKANAALTGNSREILREQFGGLADGQYKITIQEAGTGYEKPTRYKYYFGVVLTAILEKCAGRFQVINPRTGETAPPRTTTDIHEIMKVVYNPVIIITPHGATNSGGTTTNLNDRDFIGEYMETIMADFSAPPYNVEFLDAEEWKERQKAKHEGKIV